MKFEKIKNKLLYMAAGTVMLAPAFTSCQLDDPEPIPAEELYLRAFVKEYGLIDPDQDWNSAQKANVRVNVPDGADELTVFIKCGPAFYRVAYYVDVEGTLTIPIDMPEGTDKLYVQVDGRIYSTTPGGSVDASSPKKAPSRASYYDQLNEWAANDGWTAFGFPMTSGYVDLSTHAYLGETTNHPAITPDNYHMSLNQGDKVYVHSANSYPSGSTSQMVLEFTTSTGSESAEGVLAVKWRELVAEDLPVKGTQTHTIFLNEVPGNIWRPIGFFAAEGSVNIGNIRVYETRFSDMAWLLVAEDLGATDDFDFNDIIIRIESTTMNEASLKVENEYWQVINDDATHLVLGAPSRPGSRDRSYTRLRVTSMAAGGILDSFLHFRNGDKDFILGPGMEIDLTGTPTGDATEWHEWFDEGGNASPDANRRNMLNTGLNSAGRGSCTIIVPDGFSMERYSVNYKNYGLTYRDPGASADDWDEENYLDWDPTSSHSFNIQGFYMTVRDPDPTNAAAVLSGAVPGTAPMMFLIPDAGWGGYWHWPRERMPITHVYPRFKNWVTASGANSTWYLDTPADEAISNEGQPIRNPYISINR